MNSPEAAAVGCRPLEVFDDVQGARVGLWVLYPAADVPATVRFGPYALDLAMDGNPSSARCPAVLLSHGTGSTPWAYRGLGLHLARAGFAVGLLEHPGNNRADNRLANEEVNLIHRPRHVRLAAATMRALPFIDDAGVLLVGHSLGAYTVLAAAGGHPMTVPGHVPMEQREAPDAEVIKLAYPLAVESTPDVRGAVLLGPAIGWYMADGALRDVRAPLLVRTGEKDPLCATSKVMHCLRSVPSPNAVDFAEVRGAGHFAFLTPFPPELTRPDFPPSQDPDGFDRAAYQRVLQAEVTAFMRAALAVGP